MAVDLVPGTEAFPQPGAPLRAALMDGERAAQLRRGERPRNGGAQGVLLLNNAFGVRVDALPEQVQHLLLGDRTAGAQRVQAPTPPLPGRLSLRGVVVAQRAVAAFRAVRCRDLPGQVGVPVPRRQLVQRHRHTADTSSRYPFVTRSARGVRRLTAVGFGAGRRECWWCLSGRLK